VNAVRGLSLCAMALLLGPNAAKAEVWVKPEVGFQTGATDFELTLEQTNGSRDVKVRSLLEWPVNFWLAGLAAGTSFKAGGSNRWLLEGRLLTNLGNAYGKMEDSDWISSRSENVPETLFAYTKSKTESFALLGDLTFGYRFDRVLESLSIDLLVGSRQEYYSMTALGAKGEYLNAEGEFDPVDISEDIDAADYRVLHLLPFVGSRLLFAPNETFRALLEARVHALMSYSHDDHLLRKKDAFGSAYGAGFSASIAPELHIAGPLSIGLSAEFYYLDSFTGVLEQEFYGDDPATPDNEKEGTVPDSDFAVKSVRFQGMGFARLTF